MEEEIEKRKSEISGWFKKNIFFWVKDNYDKLFIFILILSFVIRIVVFMKTYNQPLWFDAAEYLATAKRWGLGLNVTDIWYYRRGFFWPLFCALFFKLGLGEVGIRFTEVILSTGIVGVTYFLIKEMFNKKFAIFSSIALSLSWVLFFFTGRPMTDIPSSFLILLSLLFFWKGYVHNKGNKYIYFFAISFGLACLTRMQSLMFVPAFLILAFTKEKFNMFKNKKLWIAIGIFVLCLSPHFINYFLHFGNPVTDIAAHYFGVEVEGAITTGSTSITTIFDYFKDMPYALFGSMSMQFGSFLKTLFLISLIMGAIFFFLDMLLGIDKIFKNKIVQTKFFIFFWIVIPYMILGYITGIQEQRYVVPMMPFLFLFFVYPLYLLKNILVKYKPKLKKTFSIFLILLIFVLFIPNIVWGNTLLESKSTSYIQLKEAGEWLKHNSNPEDIIITNSFPQIAYYSERPVGTFGRGLNNPEDHLTSFTEEEFNEFVNEYNPRFIILSLFENHEDWMYNYPVENSDIWKPIKASYPEGDNSQPILVIYESNFE